MKQILSLKATWSSLFSGLILLCFLQSCQPSSSTQLTGLWEMRFESDTFEGYWIHFSDDQTFELGQWDQLKTEGRWTLTSSSILQLENFIVDTEPEERAEWIIKTDLDQPDKFILQRTNPEVRSGISKLYLSRILHQPTKS